ncbi:MAG: nicotinamide mononucleotide transporter [Saprospiraceae bacterium]|nr:nicotinamide mononucleotide transporter [Saprospiraceae bacterium]
MDFLETVTEPYSDYSRLQIFLELVAAIFGIASVYLISRRNTKGYPTGIFSTGIYTILLYQWGLMGDMMINFYYTAMSIYGWTQWSSHKTEDKKVEILRLNKNDYFPIIFIFIVSFLFTLTVYFLRPVLLLGEHIDLNELKFSFTYLDYTDCFTTSVFLIAMWLMAKRKIENWIFWIIGNIVSIPLYILKGYSITSLQYLIFLILAFYGWNRWNKNIKVVERT